MNPKASIGTYLDVRLAHGMLFVRGSAAQSEMYSTLPDMKCGRKLDTTTDFEQKFKSETKHKAYRNFTASSV